MKFFKLLDILHPAIVRWPEWRKYLLVYRHIMADGLRICCVIEDFFYIIHLVQQSLSKYASLCASSLSWWGNFRSYPPLQSHNNTKVQKAFKGDVPIYWGTSKHLWMSMLSPRTALAITLHSICQPGLPWPQGLFQLGSPGFDFFQRAKWFSALFSEPSALKSPSPSARAFASPTASGTSLA